MNKNLLNLSPLDGRYANDVIDLNSFFSEMSLMQYRIKIEIEYLIALSNEKKIQHIESLNKKEINDLRKIYLHFDFSEAKKIKKIEKETNHDVKAVEYYLHTKIKKELHAWIHFGLTSEDINNLCFTLMWKDAIESQYIKTLVKVCDELKLLSKKYKNISMLSLTHGQPASPTTVGKEFAVFSHRITKSLKSLRKHAFEAKFSGATGNWSAHSVSFKEVNWIEFSKKFLISFDLQPNLITTQIEPNDSLAESFHQIIRINTILIDFCQDIWLYISRGVFKQKKVSSEVGSSTMPHKINPINFENAEGNLGLGSTILNHLSMKLSISRMQRDLSGSTVIRNHGVGLAHSYLALKNILKGLKRLSINEKVLKSELNEHWEILAEPIQTILRKCGKENAYEDLKKITRGEKINSQSIKKFIMSLDLNDQDKAVLLNLSPQNYIGLAPILTEKL
ncbi:MAG: adenylosuccinate lyase [Candidatus Marinimicrobia bacterium]|nr:adenylosuccinate lyase [Candidatus Neomarinimicrobiota bacterium]OUW50873.1 MAG: adenylosuccinate lyase [bacterium TMED190]